MDYSRMKERIRAIVLESPSDMVISVHFSFHSFILHVKNHLGDCQNYGPFLSPLN